jgi:hypothetical protein
MGRFEETASEKNSIVIALLCVVVFASLQQAFSAEFAGSKLGTMAGGLVGGLVFTFTVVALGNFRELTIGGNSGWAEGACRDALPPRCV